MSALATDYLPEREGPRPATTNLPPHRQLDQWPPPEMIAELLARSSSLEFVRTRQSRLADDRTVALSLLDDHAQGPVDAFIDDHEFCHIHHEPDGTVHLTLPEQDALLAIERGWAEWHALAKAGFISRSLMLVYAPRDEAELKVVSGLVCRSRDFARGLLGHEGFGH